MTNNTYERKLAKIHDLCASIERNRENIILNAVEELQFTRRDSSHEIDMVLDRLGMYGEARPILENRTPIGGKDSRVSLMLSYNGSSWLNIAITSIYMTGNKVNVRFSSKGRSLMELTEKIYRPIFGDEITFHALGGKEFLDKSLADPNIPATVVFGFDENIAPCRDLCEKHRKKLVFEGPGQDPFIVFSDANLELALGDLMVAKFWYSGQTCTAPKRVFVQRAIYDDFMEKFSRRVEKLVVGNPIEEATDISPVASGLAVRRIAAQLEDGVQRGAQIMVGGKIQGNLIYPTVVKNATDDMLGMREEVFGPVAFTSAFDTAGEVLSRAANHKYGLRAAVFGGKEAQSTAEALRGRQYCHPVPDYTFGKFGTVALNETRSVSWRGAFVTKPIGGYGYSGWIWETVDGAFRMKQGPKLLSLETSVAV